MEQTLQDFEKAWRRFETNFKGKLLEKSKKQALGLSLANLILKDASSDWFSGYGTEGKWLRDYKATCPDRAEVVTAILRHELKLGDVPAPSAPQGRGTQINTPETRDASNTSNKPNAPTPDALDKYLDMKSIIPTSAAIIGAAIVSVPAALVGGALVAAAVVGPMMYSKMSADSAKTTKTGGKVIDATGINDYVAQLQVHKEKIVAVITKPS